MRRESFDGACVYCNTGMILKNLKVTKSDCKFVYNCNISECRQLRYQEILGLNPEKNSRWCYVGPIGKALDYEAFTLLLVIFKQIFSGINKAYVYCIKFYISAWAKMATSRLVLMQPYFVYVLMFARFFVIFLLHHTTVCVLDETSITFQFG